MVIQLPDKVEQIINRITKAGYEAYAVGGCIRDSILGRVPDDWDITTSATPQQVKELFSRTVDTGIQHGTVTVMLDKEGFEVTTYRIDGKYEDGRHPTEVIFTPSLEEDLKRRDFTMNAMAYNQEVGLVDLFGGIRDMEEGVIRCVGEAKARFQEDALRIMRAIRFAAQLGYRIDEKTEEAVRELAPTLKKISAERIQVELTKLVSSPHPETMQVVYDTGVAAVILPEFDGLMKEHAARGMLTLSVMQKTRREKVLRLAALFCHPTNETEAGAAKDEGLNEAAAEEAKAILRRLRYDNDTIQKVCRLVLYCRYGEDREPDAGLVRCAISRIGEEIFPLLLELREAVVLARAELAGIMVPHTGAEDPADPFSEETKSAMPGYRKVLQWKQFYREITDRQECVSLKTLAVTGSDLMALGMKPGKELGETLKQLLELVLEQPVYNTAEYLLNVVRSRML